MNPVLTEMIATRQVPLRDGSTAPLHSEVAAAEGALLQRLIREYRPQVTLEIGCAYGVSSLYICEALAEVGGKKHIVIDPDQTTDWKHGGLDALARAGYGSLIDFHGEPSYRVLPALAAAGERIGLAFVDGFHTFDYVMVDFFYIDLLLQVNGCIVFDDTSYPAIWKLARYVATHRFYEPVPENGHAAPGRRAPGALGRILRASGLERAAARLLRPELLEPDSALGLPASNYIAFRKTADDVPGHATRGNRRFDQHHEF